MRSVARVVAVLSFAFAVHAQSFSYTGSMMSERTLHTATLLPNGKVLIVGGRDQLYRPLRTSELYDPATQSFSPGPLMSVARSSHTATLLQDGNVLIVGGEGSAITSSAELYITSSNQFVPRGGMHDARTLHVAVATTDGRVVVAAGYGPQGLALPNEYKNSVEIFDPNSGQFTSGGTLSLTPRAQSVAILLQSGEVLITGGQNGTQTPLADAVAYNPQTFASRPVGSMTTGRQYHTLTALNDGRVLVVGGYTASGQFYPVAEIFDPQTSMFSAAGSMAHGRYFHTATRLTNSQVLIAGGLNGTGSLTSVAELFDPNTSTFSPTATLQRARDSFAACLLPNGAVLLAGGVENQAYAGSTAEVYAVAPTTTTLTSSLTASRTTAHPGEFIQFLLSINNTGSIAATNVQAQLGIGSLNFVSSSGNGWSCSYASPNVTCTRSSLAIGAAPDISVVARATSPSSFNSVATVTASNANQSMSALAITVDPHATQTTLSSANNPARPGDSVQLRAQVTAGGEIASGSVTFSDGANVLGTSAVDASGLAVLSTTNLGAGMHRIVASYAGDVNFMPSTSVVLMQEVTPAQTRRRASGH